MMKKIPPNIPPFSDYDEEFFQDLDHARSDMNACTAHLFKFLLAKWRLAERRRLGKAEHDLMKSEEEAAFIDRYNHVLQDYCHMPQVVIQATGDLDQAENVSKLRHYFHQIGCEIFKLDNFPLYE